MIAFAKLEKHSLVCFEAEKLHIIKKRDILDKNVIIKNLRVANGKLVGKAFNVDKLPEFKKESRFVTIIKVRLTENGQGIIGYYYIDSFGRGHYANKDDLFTFRKVTALNGNISKGYMEVTNIESIETEQVHKIVHYSVDDYYKIYKTYNENGLITNDNKSVASTTELFGRQQEYAASGFENFVNYHKEIYGIISRSEIERVIKIHSTNTIKESQDVGQGVQAKADNKLLFYVLTFRYKYYTKSIIIHKSDSKMIQLIKNKGGKVSEVSISDIKNIIYDTESDAQMISAKSFMNMMDVKKELDVLLDELSKSKEIIVDKGRVKLNTKEFKIRRNILIGSSDFRLMMAA